MSRARYQSELRRAQAEATRQAILDAARALFVERGYAGTTVADIAAAARVAVPTVYASVGPKPTILAELRKLIPPRAGVPSDIRAAFSQVTDPRDLLSVMATGLRRLLETSGDLMFAIEAAAPFEPVAAEAWQEGMVVHRATWGVAIDRLETLGVLTRSLPAERAADMLSLLSLPWVWRTFSQDYGWTYDEIEGWMVETAAALVMEPSRPATTSARAPGKRPRA